MKKSSIYGILSIVLIVGMFFTGCASKNNASQLNTIFYTSVQNFTGIDILGKRHHSPPEPK